MGKGRNTTCITIRLEDSVVKSLEEKANKQGLRTAGEYIKSQILKSLSAITTTSEGKPVVDTEALQKFQGKYGR